jgi:hypothetical protein
MFIDIVQLFILVHLRPFGVLLSLTLAKSKYVLSEYFMAMSIKVDTVG